MIWVSLLHFYQPPTTSHELLDVVVRECYRPLLKLALKHPRWKWTANISGSLIRQLQEQGHDDVLRMMKTLIKRGQVELALSASDHPIIPLVNREVSERQVNQQAALLKATFGVRGLKTFFFPECAVDPGFLASLKKRGIKIIAADPISAVNVVSPSSMHTVRGSGVKVIFRDRDVSRTFVPNTIREMVSLPGHVITITDAELYGHHYKTGIKHLDQLLSRNHPRGRKKGLETMTLAEAAETILAERPAKQIDLRISSWETSQSDLKHRRPLSLWLDRDNAAHRALWRLAHYAMDLAESHADQHPAIRRHLDHGLASCTFWWASEHDFRHVFGPIAWHPDMVLAGAEQLVRAVRSIPRLAKSKRLAVEKAYLKAQQAVWEKHWKDHADDASKNHGDQ